MTQRQSAYERAAAAAKQLQEERERLGIPRYREDRPLEDLSPDEQRSHEQDRMLQEGRYGDFVQSAKEQLQTWQLADTTAAGDDEDDEEDPEDEDEDEEEGEQLREDNSADGEDDEEAEARRQYAYNQLAFALGKQMGAAIGQLNRLANLVKQLQQITGSAQAERRRV